MTTFVYKSAKNLYDNCISKTNENELLIKGKKDIYSINETLGKGTFGKVKLAYSTIRNPHKKYACKILEQSNMKEKDDKKRCQREMSILLQMNHNNVIKTTEIISDTYRYYIIMEYCQKGELFNHIVEQSHFTEEKSAFYYYQLISGVDYIHSKSVCHRDLKPENLLLNEENELKIIDFGLSNFFLGDNKLLKTPCGSPCYASPEMILGNNYNGFSIDVCSSGIILYAMLCGYLPFEEGEGDANNEFLFRNIVECKVEYPEEFISPIAKDLLKKIIVREPQKRITIKQIKKHPFFLMGKDIYMKKFGGRNNKTCIDYNYATFRHFPTMNFNDVDFNYKCNSNKENNNYINVNKKNKIYDSLNVDYNQDCNNFNDIYVKTNYERNNNYLNLLENDIVTYKFLNNSLNDDNNNDINVNNERKNKSHSMNHQVNINKYNKSVNNNSSTTRNKNAIYNRKKSMTLETKLNSNDIRKKFDEKIKVEKRNKTIKDSKPKLNFQQYNLFTLNNKESNFFNNYLETNYNSINNYNNENDINLQYMKTDTNFTGLKFNNSNNKSYRNNINKKKCDESSKHINANINNCFNKYNNIKKKKSFKSTFRKEKTNTPQISLHKGLVFNTQKQTLNKNRKKNNSIKKVYNNFLDKNELSNNNPKNKYSVEVRNYSKSRISNNIKNNNCKSNTNRVVHNKTNSYSNYIHNACNKKNYISNSRNSLNPKLLNEYKNFKNVLKENAKIPMTINENSNYYNNSLKQMLKYSSNRRNYNVNQKNINNRIFDSQNNNQNKYKSNVNYNLTSANIEKNAIKNKSNKNSHSNLSINTKEIFYTSRPKSQKKGVAENNNKLNNYNCNYYNDNKLINNILYTESCINTINNKNNQYENNKNNQNVDTNKFIINLNIVKQKIIVDNNKNNVRKNKYSSSLIKTYNNIDINTNNKKNNFKKNSFTQNIFANIINNENNHNLKYKNKSKKNQKSFN